MLKIFFSTAVALLLPLITLSQVHRTYTRSEPVWEFLVKGGWQYNSFTGTSHTASFGTGWHAGLALKIPILKFPFRRAPLAGAWRIQPEIMYSRRSARLLVPASGGSSAYEITYSFGHISYPLLLIYRPNDLFEFQAGPQFGILMRNEVEAPAGQGKAISPSDLRNWDYGLIAGIELNVSPLALGLRYNHGLAELAATDVAREQLGTARLHGFQLYGALVF